MIDQDLLIIAIIVITFLNWVSSKLKERSARKKGIPQELPQEELPYQEEVIEEAIEAPAFGGSNQGDLEHVRSRSCLDARRDCRRPDGDFGGRNGHGN